MKPLLQFLSRKGTKRIARWVIPFIVKKINFFSKRMILVCVKKNKYYFCTRLWETKVFKDDSVAQLVEHIPFKDGVLGSRPSWVTKFLLELIKMLEINDFQAFFVFNLPWNLRYFSI